MTKNTELTVTVNGDLSVVSNIEEYKEYILSELKNADKELKTDRDFAEADDLVKKLDAGAKALRARKEEILKQAEDVYAVVTAIDEMDESMTEVRRKLKRQIADRKAKLKDELRDDAADRCADLINALKEDFPLANEPKLQISDRLDKAMYRKSSLDSIKVAMNGVVDEIEAEIGKFRQMYQANQKLLEGIDPGLMAAFQDTSNLFNMGTDLLTAEIATRTEKQKRIIAEQQAEEERRKAEEEQKRADNAEKAAEEARNQPRPPSGSAQAPTTAPPADDGGAETEIVEPAASGGVLEDQEFIVFFRLRCDVDTARRIAGRVNDSVKAEYGVNGEAFLTTPTKLKERLING